MRPPRELTSLGRMRWTDTPAPVLDQRLSSLLLEHITARLGVVDQSHRYLYANREMLEFLGRTADQVIGHHLSQVVGPAAYAGYLPLAERVFGGEALCLEGWVDYPGRGWRYLKETFIPYGAADGPVEIVAVYGRDYTDLKQRERELTDRLVQLETSEALKSAIVDHAHAALVSTDASGRIVGINPAAQAMFGHAGADVLGRDVSDVIIPERFRGPHRAGMARMREGAAPRMLGRRLEMRALRADGNEFPMEMVLWRSDVPGKVIYTASFADLSERYNAAAQIDRQREALRQSEKLSVMGGLLAGVAHELNNPLAIVMGRASLLEEKCESLPELKADAQRIREAAERCGRIVRTFLNMARSRPSQRGPVDLNEMARAAADLLQYGYRTHGIELERMLAPALPAVQADGDQIGQVVMNLLVNAQQALVGSSGGRRVRLETGLETAATGEPLGVWLRLSDSGPGVPEAMAERIFDPFFTTKPEGSGTGLGLAVSRAHAREHGGDLVLEPTGASGGASFVLRLPVGGDTNSPHAPSTSGSVAPRQAARVLVVDDEPELADLMRSMLERAGHEVATAESGTLALALLDAARFDAIVSDLRMPDMDGAQLWHEVRARDPRLATRLLFVTGDSLSPDAREFLAQSRCAALEKPFTQADLLARVSALLGGTPR